MKKLFVFLFAVILSAPLSSLIINYITHLLMPVTARESYYEYWSFWGNVITVAIYQIPIYILVGIPVSLLIDWVIKDTKSNSNVKTYFLQLLMYSLSALVLGLYLFSISNNIESLIAITISVYTYFYILLLLRKSFN